MCFFSDPNNILLKIKKKNYSVLFGASKFKKIFIQSYSIIGVHEQKYNIESFLHIDRKRKLLKDNYVNHPPEIAAARTQADQAIYTSAYLKQTAFAVI